MGVKVAFTDWFWLIVTLQDEPVPLQPLQPVKLEPAAGTAVNATEVLEAKFALQPGGPQLIPVGLLVTVPLPLPRNETDRL